MDGAKIEGKVTVKERSKPSAASRYRAIAPKVVAKKMVVPWVVALNCATPQLKAATPKAAFRGTSKGVVTLDSLPVTGGCSTNSQPAQSEPVDEDLHTCFHCQYTCRRKYDIRRHIINVHLPRVEADIAELRCHLCFRNYSYQSALRRHMLRNHYAECEAELSGASPRWMIKACYGYCCDICGRGFAKQREMLAHRQVYHVTAQPMRGSDFQASSAKLKQCVNCGGLYRMGSLFEDHSCPDEDEEEALKKRVKELLRSNPNFRCDICSLSFMWKLILRQHRELAHSDAPTLDWDSVTAVEVRNYCASCFMAFDEEAQKEQHKCDKVEPEERLKLHFCQQCGICYRRKSDYLRHRQLRHGIAEDGGEPEMERRKPAVQCPYCDKSTTKRSHILAHIKEAHNIEVESPFVCTLCNKVFKHKATLDTHNQSYHPKDENVADNERILQDAQILVNGEPAYRCTRCNRNWVDGVRFLAHHRLHMVEHKFTCDLCGKQMRTQHQLSQHIKTIHLDIRNYGCDICQKSFHTKQSLDQHRRIHTGERPYSCEVCGKTFVSLNALISHKRVHTDFYPHACHLCPKKFKVRRSLTHHIRRHTGERPYQCEICSKTFNNSSLFSYHKKVTHSDNRPHKCEQCGSRFKANRFLQRHLKLHETRTHIQFKRRNNPEFFATHEAAFKNATGVESAQVVKSKEIVVSTIEESLQPKIDIKIVEPGTS